MVAVPTVAAAIVAGAVLTAPAMGPVTGNEGDGRNAGTEHATEQQGPGRDGEWYPSSAPSCPGRACRPFGGEVMLSGDAAVWWGLVSHGHSQGGAATGGFCPFTGNDPQH
jgi:hypothetical protein